MNPEKTLALAQLKRAALLKRLQQSQQPRGSHKPAPGVTPGIAPVSRAQHLLVLPRSALHEHLPLSFGQQRLWFLDQLDRQTGVAYQIRAALRLVGTLNHMALRAALDSVVARHEILRTSFQEHDGKLGQVFAPAHVGFALQQADLREVAPEQQKLELDALLERESARHFDLDQGPLIRGSLIQVADDAWVLFITQHHSISDAWSIGVLINELNEIYAAHCQGRAPQLPPLAIQYADYALWQRQNLQGPTLAAHLSFWTKHLTGAPSLLELPLDHPRPASRSYAGGRVSVDLGVTLSAQLRELSMRHGTTLFMTLFAGWAALLARLSGQDDVVVGTPVANRTRRELEPLLGFFVNTLALRVRFASDESVTSLLVKVKDSALAAYAHADFPFDQVVEALHPQRSLSHSPLFQTMLTLTNTGSSTELKLPGLSLTPMHLPYTATHYDLTLSLEESGGCLHGSLGYACDLFELATVEGMLACWRVLLEAMAVEDTCEIARLPLLKSGQVRALCGPTDGANSVNAPLRLPAESDWRASPSAAKFAHLCFTQWAHVQPNAIAVRCGDGEWSYAQIHAASDRLAERLRAQGVASEQVLALCAARSVYMVIGVLGILKAGAAYLPLDPAYPPERLRYMVADSGAKLLLCEASTQQLGQSLGCAQLLINASDTPTVGSVLSTPYYSEPLSPDNLAYLIYTSGSTGRPKGVMATHAGLANVLGAYQAAIALQPGERVLHLVSMSFDAASAHLFLALCSGASLHIYDRHAPGVPELSEVLRSERINYLGLPVALLGALPDIALPDLRCISTGTEACPLALLARWGKDRRFINVYGPTETSICSTMSVFDPHRDRSALHRPPIGAPVLGTRAYILDAYLQAVPVGVIGELYLAGSGMTRGYSGHAGLTAERFLPDPHAALVGARMYRTGDLVRQLASGEIDFVGRQDSQVKLRGFRIELGEIEAALRAHPAVREAAANVWQAGTDQACLLAYVVGAELSEPENLPAFLAEHLPAHMLPSAIIMVASLPLSANGKLERSALPEPEFAASISYLAPRNAIEQDLAVLWQALLKHERIGVLDNFFELGGHSLLATQLVARINQQFGIALALKAIFESPNIAALALRVATLAVSDDVAIELEPTAAPSAMPQPLSFAQQRMWFLEQMTAGDAAYHIPGALALRGDLDLARLHAAFSSLQARHEILRTRFVEIAGEPMQVIDPHAPLELTLEDATAEDLPALALAHALRPFDFAQAPLLRVCLLRLASQHHVLLVNMHHIISDGWSLRILVSELSALYRAGLEHADSPLAPLSLQYTDYARWQRAWLAAGEFDRQLEYWRAQLSGLPPLLELPTDRPRPRERSGRGAVERFSISKMQSQALQNLAQAQGATLFMFLLATFKVLLARLSGESDIFVGTLVANRTRVQFEPLIGFFVNTLVLRNHVDLKQDFPAFLRQLREQTLDAYANQDLPFEQLVEALRPSRSFSYTPLFQVLFSFQNASSTTFDMPGLAVEIMPSEITSAKFDLGFDFKQDADGVHGEVEYSTDLFEAATIHCWIASFQHMLGMLVVNPSMTLAAIPLQDTKQALRLQQSRQGERILLPAHKCVPSQIIAQAQRRPGALAYVAGGEQLSYAELDRRSNQLASVLRARGVGLETPVGICLTRSPELVIAILAVWKAGGVYLPMDPSYPSARLRYMLEDSGAKLLLTHAASGSECAALASAAVSVLDLTVKASHLALQSAAPVAVDLSPSNLAYIIYTSGSTGQPKGVQVEHRALHQHCHGVLRAYRLTEQDRVLHFAALGFDISLDQLIPTLLVGACVVARDAALWEANEFAEKLVQLDISVADLPSAFWHALAKEWRDDANLPVNPRLRLFLVGGEAMASDALRNWRQTRYAHVPLLNGYGPTETTITSSGHYCSEDEPGASVPIGRPFANRRFYVLDEQLQPLPACVPGELYIAGEGLARGYYGLPGLSASVFLPDPHAESDPNASARMYRTGDRVRFRADGALEFLGRLDGQIKLHGYRIELEEVEAALLRLPGVREAAAAVRVFGNGERRLVGYLVTDNGLAINSSQLRRQLLSELPEHFVPAILHWMAALPSHNGKLERKQLPTPEPTPEQLDESNYVAPRNVTEAWLAQLWAELLGVPQVGVESNFFSLGGHSLLAIQLLARVRRHFAVAVPVRQLFDAPSVAALADYIQSLERIRAQAEQAHAHVAGCENEREEFEI